MKNILEKLDKTKKYKLERGEEMNREQFIELYRERLGCKGESDICWCKVCITLDKIWDRLKNEFARKIRNLK